MNISAWQRTDTRWYLGVPCRKCGVPILFALDHSEGFEDRKPPPAGKLVLTCPLEKCGHKADYTSAKILRFQKQPDEKISTARTNESSKSRKPSR